MAKTTEEVMPASSVEMPPNKAIAATGAAMGSGGLSSIVVGLALYYFAPDTPAHIVAMWDAAAAVIFGGAATFFVTYLTPHGAVLKQ